MHQVKNIDNSNWKDYKYMVVRVCSDEQTPNDGFWYYGSYNDLSVAYGTAKAIDNGRLLATEEVKPYDEILENKTLHFKLNDLQQDMEYYAHYLECSTYHPFDKEKEFADRLKTIIETYYE